MKEDQLRKYATCAACGKPIGNSGIPLFYRVTIERFGVDIRAMERQKGLGMHLGSHVLAAVMGPNEDMAKPVMEPIKLAICESCNVKPVLIAQLAEMETAE